MFKLKKYILSTLVKKTRHWNTGGNALNVETAGYALMTQVLLGRTVYAGPIVTYITGQRQGGVGFVSTQVREVYGFAPRLSLSFFHMSIEICDLFLTTLKIFHRIQW